MSCSDGLSWNCVPALSISRLGEGNLENHRKSIGGSKKNFGAV